MRLVEGVGCELLPIPPNLIQHLAIMAISHTAIDKLGLQLIQLGFNLLTHRLTQRVGLASRKSSEQARE